MNTKDNQILAMLRENKSYSTIQNELYVSPSRIASIKKKYFTTSTETAINISANKHISSIYKDLGEWQNQLMNKQKFLHEQALKLEYEREKVIQKQKDILKYQESILHEGLEVVKKDIEIKDCQRNIKRLESENDQLKAKLGQLEKKLKEKTEMSNNQSPSTSSTSFIEKIPEYWQPVIIKIIMKFLNIKDDGFFKKYKKKFGFSGLKDTSSKMSFFKRIRRYFINKIF